MMKYANNAQFWGVLAIAAAGWAIGCSDSNPSPPKEDAAVDSTADIATDTATDTPQKDVDVQKDAAPDVTLDAQQDAEPDAEPDAEADAEPDAEPDAEADAEPDAEPDVVEPEPKFKEVISECGGFSKPDDRPLDYCESEKLVQSYDSATKVFSLTHARAHRNTCGERSLEATYDTATKTLTVIETDAPRGSERCRGTCVMDYLVTIENLTGNITVKWKQNVVDVGINPGVPKPTEIPNISIEIPAKQETEVLVISDQPASGTDCATLP